MRLHSPTVPKHLTCPSPGWPLRTPGLASPELGPWVSGLQPVILWCCFAQRVLLLRNTTITQNRVGNRAREVPQVRSRTMFGAITNCLGTLMRNRESGWLLVRGSLQPRQKTEIGLYILYLSCVRGLIQGDDFISSQDENNCTNNSKEA